MSFYLINKEKGITSNDVVCKLKKIVNVKKAGHSGTLDPFAEGLLIIATNEDTKFLDRFLKSKKTYEGIIKFGIKTDTLDVDGKIIEKINDDFNIREEDLNNVINKNFIGKIKQVPPSFSAIRVNGERMYNLARKNINVELKPVDRIIYSFEIKKIKPNEVKFKIEVSSGTYIRAIARDISEIIKIPSIILELKRTKIDVLDLKKSNSITDKNLKKFSRKEIIKIEEINVSEEEIKKILEGKIIEYNSTKKELIFINGDIVILTKNVGLNKYFIKKRIK